MKLIRILRENKLSNIITYQPGWQRLLELKRRVRYMKQNSLRATTAVRSALIVAFWKCPNS